MRKIFLDKEIETAFQKNGYIIVPLLNADEVNELTTFYNNNKKLGSTNFHSTHFSKDRLFKRNVHEKIISVFEKPLKNILINYNLTFANFMVKELGENSVMPLHADWTYVDEAAFQSLGIWCPLTDTNEKNGMLGVVPCSHNFKPNKRGPKIPSPFHDFNQYIIDNYGKLLPVKAGEVVIYDHRTLHFSPPNLSNNTRIAINIVATPAEATLLHFANFGSLNEIECFQPKDSNFYVEYDHFEKPDQSENSVLLKQDVLLFTKGEVDAIFKQNTNKLFHFFLNFFNKLK